MQLEAAQFLIDAANYAGIEAEIYENYSGRGMRGESTAGVVVENPIALLGAAIEYAAEGDDRDLSGWDLHKLKTDSMGLSSILY